MSCALLRVEGGLRGAILLAFVAPALVVAAASIAVLVRGADASPLEVLALAPALLWTACALGIGDLRRFLIDLGDWLLARVPCSAWLLAGLAALLLATSGWDPFWVGSAAWLTLMAGASLRRQAAARPRELAKTLALLGINALLFLALDRVVYHLVIPTKSHNSVFIDHDPYLGWKLRADFSLERVTDSYTARETINRLGFRTRELPFAKPPGVRRVVILGDSHTEGYTVSDHETYAVRLENMLSERIRTEVVSLGVAGFSTDQELVAYLRYGRRYEPDLVLLQFSPNDVPFNTLDRYWRGTKPVFRRYGETLLLANVPAPNLRRLRLTSHPLLRSSGITLVVESYLSRQGLIRDVESHDPEEAWRVTDLLIRDLAGVVRADGAELVVFNAVPDALEEDRRIRELAAGRRVHYLDLAPAFDGDLAAHRVPEDRHWNGLGHEKVAGFLAERLAPLLDAVSSPEAGASHTMRESRFPQ